MALMTPQEYIESLRKLNTRVYMFGEKIENWVDHPMIRPSINCVAMTYALAQDPQYAELMTVKSSLTGHTINRFTHLHQSTEDLMNKVKMQRLLGQKTASCFQRCVGMDVARELMRNADDLKAKTDIPDNVYEGIGQNKAKVLHLFIRRGVAQAKFSVQELREMEKLPGVQLIINEDDFDLDDETIEVAGKDKLTRQMVEELFAVREMAEDLEDDGDVDFEGNPADRKYYVHFNSAPTEILGEDGKVKAIRVERTETGADGKMHRTGEFTDYPVEAVYHAIGYKPAEAPGITYDEHGAHLANANGDGRITAEADGGKVRDRLYATGWAKRGPVGLIGSTKSDALAIVTNMLEDLAKAAEGGRVAADRDPESIDRLLAERGIRPIDFAGWKKVDAFERAEGAKEGREHKKVIEPDQMRELAHA